MTLAIGEVAKRTGLSVSAVRYYDRTGLVAAVERVGGKRRFSADTVGRINFIRRARGAGFSLDEIRAMLDESAVDWAQVLDDKRSELLERRRELDIMLNMLDEVAACGCEAIATCPAVISGEIG